MTARINDVDTWEGFLAEMEALTAAVNRSRAVNVNTDALRGAAKELVQKYFREARPDLEAVGLAASDLEPLDEQMQALLRLANGRNAKRSYVATLRASRQRAQELELHREMRLGAHRAGPRPEATEIELQIIETLRNLAPTAAASYEQAIADLRDDRRLSFRGPAHELREALREALDRLAPDKDVEKADWYTAEKGRDKPTQRQKMRYILSSRGLSAKARKTPEESVDLVEEKTAAIGRASYERSSVAAHVASSRAEVRQLKMYVDTVLAEILELHR